MFFDFTKLNRLPSLPVVAVRLLERFSDPDVALSCIVEIIQNDPAITAKILRAANSAQYGIGRPVTDLVRAVGLLGKKTVTSLALCFSLSEESMCRGPFAALYKSVWLQCVLQAATAETIARRYDRGMEGEYFANALLADIGRLAMLKSAPAEYAAVAERVGREHLDIENCEDEAFGTTHTGLSIALLEHWNLPERFCNAVRRRNLSAVELANLPPGDERRLSQAVAFATSVGEYFCSDLRGLALARVTDLAAELYAMNPDNVRELLDQIQNRVNAASDLFETDLTKLGSPAELMSEAMEQLGRLSAAAADGVADERVRTQLLDENGELKERVQELIHRSTIDALTGVFNRGYFDEQLEERAAVARASKHPLGLLFLDADHFKTINDSFGHPAGDAALKQIASVLTRIVRADDLVARYGGEEFVILVTNHPGTATLEILGERLRAAIEQERIAVDRGVIRVTVSVGGSVIAPPFQADAIPSLLAAADAALYAAKDAGRNRVLIRDCTVDRTSLSSGELNGSAKN